MLRRLLLALSMLARRGGNARRGPPCGGHQPEHGRPGAGGRGSRGPGDRPGPAGPRHAHAPGQTEHDPCAARRGPAGGAGGRVGGRLAAGGHYQLDQRQAPARAAGLFRGRRPGGPPGPGHAGEPRPGRRPPGRATRTWTWTRCAWPRSAGPWPSAWGSSTRAAPPGTAAGRTPSPPRWTGASPLGRSGLKGAPGVAALSPRRGLPAGPLSCPPARHRGTDPRGPAHRRPHQGPDHHPAGKHGVVLYASYQSAAEPQALARQLGWPAQGLPLEPPLDANGEGYLHHIDLWVEAIAAGKR